MSRATGAPLDGDAHLKQSLWDILTTPIGTRIGRRDYGSLVPELVDQPMNAVGRIRLFAAAAQAIGRWERRIRIARLSLTGAAGAYALAIEATRTDRPTTTVSILTVPLHPNGTLAPYA